VLPPPRSPVYLAPDPIGRPPAPLVSAPHGTQTSLALRNILIVASATAVVALAVAAAVLASRKPGSKQLDVAKAQQGVAEILSDPINGYGAEQVSQVSCNGGTNPPIADGRTFSCKAVIDGGAYDVTVTFKGNDGTYEVDWPR